MIESYLSDSTLVLLPIVFVCYYYIMWSSKGSFARKQLEKHGWTDGVGLGAKEHGITQAIKVKLKMDSAGVGHDPAQEFTHHWWDHAFNKAVSNITVEAKEDGVIVRSSKKSKKEEVAVQKKAAYGNFVKVSLLSNGIEEEMTAGVKHDDEEEDSSRKTQTLLLPEDELFKRCGGRTAHKAARHGLKLNGKLQRIEEQERLLLEKYQPQSLLSTDQEKSAMKMSIQSEPKLVNHKLSSELRQSDMHASSQYDLPTHK
ncbi:G patch domain-containing protein 4-like isoform X1 [Pomacea canaliculata]|uniref:G patch domain-containing protein 4-like isoform X1 n=1 Tax=Pomacea canaliculata TaxID=400727 RepID=UPI000D72E9A2|nr:G patch domain-containing protein 4-like isoform X1 [Pomacea canaliculata]